MSDPVLYPDGRRWQIHPDYLLHDDNCPGVFYAYDPRWESYMEEDGRAPCKVSLSRARSWWSQLGESGPLQVRWFPSWFLEEVGLDPSERQ